LLFAIGASFAYLTFGHVRERVVIWQHALEPRYVHDEGYQLAQAEFAMAAGGIGGAGLGRGEPTDIPFASTDSISAAGASALGVLFAVLFAQLNYMQVFAASTIFNNPANEKRRIVQDFKVRRGEILARDGHTVLADSIPTSGELKYLRRYPQGSLYGHITGFDSFVYGPTRLESTYDDFLAARATELLPSTIEDEILNRPKRGGTVVTTIDPRLQQVAEQALSSAQTHGGAVAALDPPTGAVRALAAIPSDDPNP